MINAANYTSSDDFDISRKEFLTTTEKDLHSFCQDELLPYMIQILLDPNEVMCNSYQK